MRIFVLGAGAIGGGIGGFLARARREVVLLARGAHADAIRTRGLRVETPDGPFTVQPEVRAAGQVRDWRADDVVILAVKTQDAGAALAELAPPPHVAIACATNGTECERLALRHVDHVYGVCVMMPASFTEP